MLLKLGASKIFDPAQADLSGISGKKGDLVVSKVVQKAFIDLNEGGVEAAAATYVGTYFNRCYSCFNFDYAGVVLTSVISQPPKDVVFNRPFIYYILYKKCIIFAGRVKNPKY